MTLRDFDIERELERIPAFIKQQIENAGMSKAIVGLSGGIDSSLVAALCVRVLGHENVQGFMLPYRESHPASLADAITIAEHLDIDYRVIDISPMVDTYFNVYEPDADPMRRGNRKARERMCILYDQSAKHNGLVVGTGNKSELLVGYVTQYGDGACAFEPIGHIYKTEVYEMARHLGLPDAVITKAPTADLWDGQTDEDEMGITYARLDTLLHHMVDLGEDTPAGFSQEEIDKVRAMVRRSAFKRALPPSLSDVWNR